MKMDYGLSKDMPEDDERQELWKKQREERGFDDTEIWNLDLTLAKFMIPRLKEYKKSTNGHPLDLTPEEWDEKIDKMIVFFELIIKDMSEGQVLNSKEQGQYEEGAGLFFDYFRHLWW